MYFVSSNKNKFAEIKAALSKYSINAGFLHDELEEIQSDKLEEIALHKGLDAYYKHEVPVIVEDDALFVNALNGFPGPYSSYVHKTIGNKGILCLLERRKQDVESNLGHNGLGKKISRKAQFVSVIAFCDKKVLKSFTASVQGEISKNIVGSKWGFDPIFIPKGYNTTFSKIEKKNSISHRAIALDKFAKWWIRKKSV